MAVCGCVASLIPRPRDLGTRLATHRLYKVEQERDNILLSTNLILIAVTVVLYNNYYNKHVCTTA